MVRWVANDIIIFDETTVNNLPLWCYNIMGRQKECFLLQTVCFIFTYITNSLLCLSCIRIISLSACDLFPDEMSYDSDTSKLSSHNIQVDRVKRIWYLSPMRAAKVQASLHIRAVSPEPSLLAHTSSESRGTFRQKARSLAPLNGWACAIKICHDGMVEDTNSLDGAQLYYIYANDLVRSLCLSKNCLSKNICIILSIGTYCHIQRNYNLQKAGKIMFVTQ